MTDYFRRMRQLKGSTADWATDDLVIGDGEIAFELGDDDVIRAKVGDGSSTFTNLDYLVDPLWSRVGTDIYTVQTGRVTIGSENPKNKLSVMGGDSNIGVYRAAVAVDGESMGGLLAGGYSEADTPNPGVAIRAVAVGTWSPTNFGAYLRFSVTPEDATTPEAAMFLYTDKSLDLLGDRVRVRSSKTPASASADGLPGEICWDSDYVYVCVSTDTWKRAAISTW
jgi:hypothetical protein